jgi:hypothetical protein
MGGAVLAADLFRRERELGEARKFKTIGDYLAQAGLKARYRGHPIDNPDFALLVLARKTSLLAWIGVALLAIGLFLLVLYHLIQIMGHPAEL